MYFHRSEKKLRVCLNWIKRFGLLAKKFTEGKEFLHLSSTIFYKRSDGNITVCGLLPNLLARLS